MEDGNGLGQSNDNQPGSNNSQTQEDVIRRSNERYTIVSKVTNDSIWDWDLIRNEVVRPDKTLEGLLGFPDIDPSEVDAFWRNHVHAEDWKRITESRIDLFGDPSKDYWEDEYRFLKPDGTYAIIYDRGYIMRDDDGKAVRMIGASRDISSIKETETQLRELNDRLQLSEKKYSILFHLSPQPMWVYDAETYRFVQVNQAAIDQYGYSEEEFLSMTILDIRPFDDRKKVEQVLDSTRNSEQKYKGTFRHSLKSGKIIYVEIYSNPIRINNKSHRTVIAIDITEKMRFENKITRAIIKTQEDERYEIGSELHDNVCQILGTSQLCLQMLKKSLKEEDMQWYNRCKQNIINASREIRDLSHRLAPAFFDDTTLEDAFRRLLNDFNINNKFTVRLRFDNALNNIELTHDIQLNLYRILQEQLRNILKYANASVIDVAVQMPGDGYLLFSVADNGSGFDVSTVKKGIGLANMRRRAELFNGFIKIDAAPGKGCKITIAIPLSELPQ